MRLNTTVRIFTATFAVLALANCTTTKRAATPTQVTSAGYQANFDRVTGQAPTSDMPTQLSGNYVGVTKMDLREGATVRGELLGDIDLDVAWTDGQTANPFTGTATNFRGTLDGIEETFDGTLTVDNTFGGAIGRVENTVPLPTGGTQTIATGALSVTLTGDVDIDGTTGTAIMSLGGAFFGPGAAAATGPALLQFATPSGPGNGVGSGTYYLERQ